MSDRRQMRERAGDFFLGLQDEICRAIERSDGLGSFHEDHWEREGGGGGRTRVLEGGEVFEKAGVNFSEVHGMLDDTLASSIPVGEGAQFFATGVSLVLHPVSPLVPTVHANFRYLERGIQGWFGGGLDLTPCYPYLEDARHFHSTLKQTCDRFDLAFYPRFKRWCDEYFFIRHRNETRGVGGVFFDYLTGSNQGPLLDADSPAREPDTGVGIEQVFDFVKAMGGAFLPAYLPIVERRQSEPYSERERQFQLVRRGRYVEFNLVYDRGTHFGLKTRGRAESILMSLPPLARWVYDYQPEPGTREAEAMDFFRPRAWLGEDRLEADE